MNTKWLASILIISILLLIIQKTHETRSLSPYFRGEKAIKLKHFETARLNVTKNELELLKLWESIITGRSAPLSKITKEKYRHLGLNHIFTPSGFHLSSILFPFFKLLKNQKIHLCILIVMGVIFMFMPGFASLKRMILIKGHQKILGLHAGFCLALVIDMLFGSFQDGALSFTYSFLFLGIIYSGLSGIVLIIWFFLAQMCIAYFQGSNVSVLLLFLSPLLNLGFTLAMPVLFFLSCPLWGWQLHLGIAILKFIQALVDFASRLILALPSIEIHMGLIMLIFLIGVRRWNLCLVVLIFLSNGLNADFRNGPSMPRYDYEPQGKIWKRVYTEKEVKIWYKDGRCNLKLVRGIWWKSCFPRRRSSITNND